MTNNNFSNLQNYSGTYSERGLWSKLAKVAVRAGLKVVYLAMILFYVLQSPELSKRDKSILMGALGYFILPLDLIPDAVPMVGFSDDLAAFLAVYMTIKANITPEVENKARERVMKWFPTAEEKDFIL